MYLHVFYETIGLYLAVFELQMNIVSFTCTYNITVCVGSAVNCSFLSITFHFAIIAVRFKYRSLILHLLTKHSVPFI
jgi:hypothetical protein